MKIVQFLYEGRRSVGIMTEQGILDLSERAPELCDLGQCLDLGSAAKLASLAKTPGIVRDPSKIRLLPLVTSGARIFCVALNYQDHVTESKRDLPQAPSIFTRTPQSLVEHGGTVIRPRCSEQLDFEGELAVFIGRSGRDIPEAEALKFISGYSCFHDGSVRDYQKESMTAGKNFEASGAIGPYIVTADEIPDPSALTLTTRLNGLEVQRSGTNQMIFPIPKILNYISRFTTLLPGDVIATGTPAGVGARRSPPLWLKSDDTLEVDISSIGVLKVTVADQGVS